MTPQPIGTATIIVNEKKEILLGKRKNGYKSDEYGLPGGRVHLGEPLLEAAKRELTEETGLTSNNLEYIGLIREQQESQDFLHFGFVCENWEGNLNNCEPEKCEGWEWIDIHNLPVNTLTGHKDIIQLYLKPNTHYFKEILKT